MSRYYFKIIQRRITPQIEVKAQRILRGKLWQGILEDEGTSRGRLNPLPKEI
jgi:hypothetical protein